MAWRSWFWRKCSLDQTYPGQLKINANHCGVVRISYNRKLFLYMNTNLKKLKIGGKVVKVTICRLLTNKGSNMIIKNEGCWKIDNWRQNQYVCLFQMVHFWLHCLRVFLKDMRFWPKKRSYLSLRNYHWHIENMKSHIIIAIAEEKLKVPPYNDCSLPMNGTNNDH